MADTSQEFHRRISLHVSAAVNTASKILDIDVTNMADAFVQDIVRQFSVCARADTAAYLRALADLVDHTDDDAASDAIYERMDELLNRIDKAAHARAALLAAEKPAAGAN